MGGANKKIAPAFLADFQGIPHQLGTCGNPPRGTRFRRHTLTRPLHYGLVPLLPAKRCVLCGWWGGRATASGAAQNRSNANHAVFGLMSTVVRVPLRRHQYGATDWLAYESTIRPSLVRPLNICNVVAGLLYDERDHNAPPQLGLSSDNREQHPFQWMAVNAGDRAFALHGWGSNVGYRRVYC
jgi:hypothetical protein